jgi:hypothetical protein
MFSILIVVTKYLKYATFPKNSLAAFTRFTTGLTILNMIKEVKRMSKSYIVKIHRW